MNNNISWFNKMLVPFAPKTAAERMQWELYAKSFYDIGTDGKRVNQGWNAVNTTGELTNQGSRDSVRAKARDLERNADIAESILGAHERNIIGCGFTPEPKVLNNCDELDEKLNKHILKKWKKWCKRKNCDLSEQNSFTELLWLIIRRTKTDGGILIIKNYNSRGMLPFCLQLREVDDIDGTCIKPFTKEGNRIINGIEVDKYNRHVAYWIKETTPDGYFIAKTVRVPAENVIFFHRKKRVSQIREMSELSNTASRIRDINEFCEAVSMKERILACFSIFIKKLTPNQQVGRGVKPVDSPTNEAAPPKTKIGPGMVTELMPGEDVTIANPNGQAANAKEFVTFEQRMAAAGQGLSYETVSRDMSQVNYSSARQGLLEDRIMYRMWQLLFIEKVLDEVYEEFLTALYLAGQLPVKDFMQNKEKYLEHTWITPGWDWIDPLREVNANKIALETNQTTLSEIAAQKGKDYREILKQRKQEIKELSNLGVTINDNTTT